MIKKKYILSLILTLILGLSIHLKTISYEKEILSLKKKEKKLISDIELKEINWTYITRPENLNNINSIKYNLKPIILEDILDIKNKDE